MMAPERTPPADVALARTGAAQHLSPARADDDSDRDRRVRRHGDGLMMAHPIVITVAMFVGVIGLQFAIVANRNNGFGIAAVDDGTARLVIACSTSRSR
jgi:hypothetical protein